MPKPNEPLVHLVCGPTGAGKTTHALALARDLVAVRYSIDEWMMTLFWRDSPDPIEFAWAFERVTRCEEQIWSTALQVAGCGVPVILDLAFTTVEHRSRFAALAADADLAVRLHVVDGSAAVRWTRVERRNRERGETYRLAVSREMFDFMEGRWEAPTDAEKSSLDVRMVMSDGEGGP